MARKYQNATPSGHTILVIDDSPDIVQSSRSLLEAEGHRVLIATDGPSGIAMAQREHPHLILVDYFMPGMTGEEVVRAIRTRDRLVQIILQTGYSGEKPARVMLRQLDIQGYHDKGAGAEQLLLWVDSALKAYRSALATEKHRMGLQYILDITPDLHRLQPVDELLQGLLWQVEGLVGAENCFLATYSSPELTRVAATAARTESLEGFVALADSVNQRTQMEIRVGTGRFRAGISTESLPDPERSLVRQAIESGGISFSGGVSVLPLQLGSQALGAIFIDRRPDYERDRELLEIFATQAASALQSALLYGENTMLYNLATKDPTSGVFLRGYAMQQFQQQLKRSYRNSLPISVLMMDLDKFKPINDSYGHLAGDRALHVVGDLLGRSVRETDCVARYGGDEFIAILPDTPAEGAEIVARRVLAAVNGVSVESERGAFTVHMSVGVATLLPMQDGPQYNLLRNDVLDRVSAELIARADAALYARKGTGQLADVAQVAWQEALIDRAA
jgi:two-component system, cell cycle response regulator